MTATTQQVELEFATNTTAGMNREKRMFVMSIMFAETEFGSGE